MSQNKTDAHYTSGTYWEQHLATDSAFKADLLLRLVKQANVPIEPTLSGAEVGCGTGSFLAAWHHKTGMQTLIGTDIAPNGIAIAQGRFGALPIQFLAGDVDVLPKHVDHIYVMDVVEHVEKPYQFLRALRGRSTHLFLHLPIEQSLSHLLAKKPTNSLATYQHLHFYSWETAQLLVKQCGFEIVAHQFTAAVPLSIHLRGSRLTKIVRRVRLWAYRLNDRLASILFGGSVMLVLRPQLGQSQSVQTSEKAG